MGQKIVECVPNFSEGRDMAKIKQITDVIEAVDGAELMDVDPGADTNRTVVTIIGEPGPVKEAAFQAIAKASQILDMSTHSGAHPRMGATDVCPFVPVSNLTLEECAEFARELGERVGKELEIPVYLYESAASKPEWKNLAVVRKGEYEALAEKLQKPEWKPDFGPAKFNAKTGATAISAREFLIAYNITLNTRDKAVATDIAFDIREKGRSARKPNRTQYYMPGEILRYQDGSYPCGNCDFVGKTFDETVKHCKSEHDFDLKDLFKMWDKDPAKPEKQPVRRSGLFSHCKAIGWYVDEFKRAQISVNLTDYKVTPPHLVLDAVRKLATERGVEVTGSEIVGLVPYKAMEEAGRYYLKKQGRSPYIPVQDLLEAAVFSMGLEDVAEFDIASKVIGLPMDIKDQLCDMTVKAFTDEVSRDTPAPGGGSIAALAGALGAGLSSMVTNLTQPKSTSDEQEELFLKISKEAHEVKEKMILGVDLDTDAFNDYMDAMRLPKNTKEEQATRLDKMEEGLKTAVNVPYSTALESFKAMELGYDTAKHGNQNSITDAAVGTSIAYAGVQGGCWNVLINLKDIRDQKFISTMIENCSTLMKKAKALRDEAEGFADKKLLEFIEKKKK